MSSHSFRILLLACLMVVSLSGCLVQRFETFAEQVCHFDEYFTLETGQDFRLALRDPVLRYEDIVLVTGVEPYTRQKIAGGEEMHYRLSKVSRPGEEPIEFNLSLRFRDTGDNLSLSEIYIDTPYPMTVTREDINEFSRQACEMPMAFKPRIKTPLDHIDESDLPPLAEVRLLAGEPAFESDTGTLLQYEYILEGTTETAQTGMIELLYDESGEKLLKVHNNFGRYSTVADFRENIAVTSISLMPF